MSKVTKKSSRKVMQGRLGKYRRPQEATFFVKKDENTGKYVSTPNRAMRRSVASLNKNKLSTSNAVQTMQILPEGVVKS